MQATARAQEQQQRAQARESLLELSSPCLLSLPEKHIFSASEETKEETSDDYVGAEVAGQTA